MVSPKPPNESWKFKVTVILIVILVFGILIGVVSIRLMEIQRVIETNKLSGNDCGKLPTFNGDEERWPAWNFSTRACLVTSGLGRCFKIAGDVGETKSDSFVDSG